MTQTPRTDAVFKRSTRLLVRRVRDSEGALWIVKHRTARGPVDRLKMRARVSQGYRQAFGARLLARLGLEASIPLAIGRCRLPLRRVCEIVVLPYVEGPTLLELLMTPGDRSVAEAMLAAAAGQLGELARRGAFNRDPKPSNVVVRDAGDLCWIDTVGVRPTAAPQRRVAHMLASMCVEPMGCGSPISAECRRAMAGAAFRALHGRDGASDEIDRLARSVDARVRAVRDPRPLDPLTPAQQRADREPG